MNKFHELHKQRAAQALSEGNMELYGHHKKRMSEIERGIEDGKKMRAALIPELEQERETLLHAISHYGRRIEQMKHEWSTVAMLMNDLRCAEARLAVVEDDIRFCRRTS